MFTLLLLFFATGCAPVETNNGVDSDTITPTDTDTAADSEADTGKEIVGGNCGGPEPLEDSLWICENGTNDLEGEAWPAAGGPEDLEQCLTSEGWTYELSRDGRIATLTRSDGQVFTCELDE